MSGTTEEDLGTLSDLVPLLAKKVADTHEAAEALETAATELQHEVDEAREAAANRLAALQDALPGLVVQVEAEEKALKEAETALLGAWHEAAPRLAHSGEAVAKHADEVVSHTHDLRAALAEAGTRIDHAEALGEAALAKLAHDAEEAENHIKTCLQALEEQVEQFHQAGQAANEALTAAAQVLMAALGKTTGDADSALREALDNMTEKTTAHKAAAKELYQSLHNDIMDELEATMNEVDREVMTPIAEAETHLRDELERLVATAGTHEKELREHGQALEKALEEVKTEAGIVPEGVAQINEAARKLGI